MSQALESTLLTPSDPPPVDVVNGESDAPLLLVCEHGGHAVPHRLSLGVTDEVRLSHRGWDIGAEAVARRLADHLDAPLVIQRYSRLVIDANRPPLSPTSMPERVDGADIPGNRGLSAGARQARVDEIFTPMDEAISRLLGRPRRAAFSVHSFTPVLGGTARPWHAGFLTRASVPTATALIEALAAPERLLALNEPYRIEDDTDWFIPIHAEPRGLAHCLIEIRNDQIDTDAGAAIWARLLADAIETVLEGQP